MPLDPILEPVLAGLPPFPDHIEDWDRWRKEETVNASAVAAQVAEPAPEGATKQELTIAVDGGRVDVHIYTPDKPGPLPGHLYLHGGGWVAGSIHNAFIDIQMRERAVGAGCVVVAVDYRKAPDHPFPTGLNDSYSALLWTVGNAEQLGIDLARFSVGGGSAGANLAAALCLKARDENGPAIGLQLLEVPALDLTLKSPSVVEMGQDYGLTASDIRRLLGYYLTDPAEAEQPYASPLLAADLAGLPTAHIMSAEFDPLRDDGARYADRLDEAGVSSTFSLQRGQIHHSPALTAVLPAARAWRAETLDVLSAFHRP